MPLSTWYDLEQRDWRIASTKHANSYLFRADRGEDGVAGICTPATVGACCGDSTTRAWYVAATKPAPWIAAAGFKRVDGRPLASLDSWSRREAVLIPGKASGGQLSWKTSIEPVLVAALPGDTWCVAREPVDAPPGASTGSGGSGVHDGGLRPTALHAWLRADYRRAGHRSGRHGAAPPRRRDHLADRA